MPFYMKKATSAGLCSIATLLSFTSIRAQTGYWQQQLELTKAKIDKSLQTYFNTWKFKHPYPEDFKAVIEKEMNEDLSNYFQLLQKTGNL